MNTNTPANLTRALRNLFIAGGLSLTAALAHGADVGSDVPYVPPPTDDALPHSPGKVSATESPEPVSSLDEAARAARVQQVLKKLSLEEIEAVLAMAQSVLNPIDYASDPIQRLTMSHSPQRKSEQSDLYAQILRQRLTDALRQDFTDTLQLSVSVKDNNPKCFLEKATWSSCFDGLPKEPEWATTAHSGLPSPEFWKLRSLWTESAVDLVK